MGEALSPGGSCFDDEKLEDGAKEKHLQADTCVEGERTFSAAPATCQAPHSRYHFILPPLRLPDGAGTAAAPTCETRRRRPGAVGSLPKARHPGRGGAGLSFPNCFVWLCHKESGERPARAATAVWRESAGVNCSLLGHRGRGPGGQAASELYAVPRGREQAAVWVAS